MTKALVTCTSSLLPLTCNKWRLLNNIIIIIILTNNAIIIIWWFFFSLFISSRYIALKQYRTASPSPCCASKHVCHLPGGRSRTAVIRSTLNTSASTAAVRSTLLLRPTPYCPRWEQIIFYAFTYIYIYYVQTYEPIYTFFWSVFFFTYIGGRKNTKASPTNYD